MACKAVMITSTTLGRVRGRVGLVAHVLHVLRYAHRDFRLLDAELPAVRDVGRLELEVRVHVCDVTACKLCPKLVPLLADQQSTGEHGLAYRPHGTRYQMNTQTRVD